MEWDDIAKLVQLFKDNELGELEYEDEHFRVSLKSATSSPVVPHAVLPTQVGSTAASVVGERPSRADAELSEEKGFRVTSPFVGNFYRQPSPDASAYVEMGQTVSKGQVLCIVEAMKLMNEIEAECGGRIARIFVENGRPVEYGEPLFLIEPL